MNERITYIDLKLDERQMYYWAARAKNQPAEIMKNVSKIAEVAHEHTELGPVALELIKGVVEGTYEVTYLNKENIVSFLEPYLTEEDTLQAGKISVAALCNRAINRAQGEIASALYNKVLGKETVKTTIDFLVALYSELSITRQFSGKDNSGFNSDQLSQTTIDLIQYLNTLSLGMKVGDALRDE